MALPINDVPIELNGPIPQTFESGMYQIAIVLEVQLSFPLTWVDIVYTPCFLSWYFSILLFKET